MANDFMNSPQFKVRQGIVDVINAVIHEEKGNRRKIDALQVSKALNPLLVELMTTLPPEQAAIVIASCIHGSMQCVCRIGFAA